MKQRHADPGFWFKQFKPFVAAWTGAGDEYLGDNPFDRFVYVEEAESWEDFLIWQGQRGRWAFRGQSDANWLLYPSIDRVLWVHGGTEDFSYSRQENSSAFEDQLLFRFQQRAHQFEYPLPDESDLISWLAKMQHHGTSTRLLDWSWSPYVAAYFALEDEKDKAAIWAIDVDWLENRGNQILGLAGKAHLPAKPVERAVYLNELLRGDTVQSYEAPRMLVWAEPRQTDAWMTSQRGLFICKSWNIPSFNQLLMRMMMHPQLVEGPVIRKLEVGKALRFHFLKQLQSINVHRGSLFPDLDGFARSLTIDLQIQMDDLREEYDEQIRRQRRHQVSSTTLGEAGDSDSAHDNEFGSPFDEGSPPSSGS